MKKPVRERKGKSVVKKRKAEAKVYYELSIQEALKLFVDAKKREGVRSRTIEDYYKHIEWFTDYLQVHHPDVTMITSLTNTIIRGYIQYMQEERNPYQGDKKRQKERKGLSPNTINIRLRTLRAMCRFWTEEGYLIENPAQNIKLIKTDGVDDLNGLTDDEIKALLNVLNIREYSGFRDKIIMLLLLDTGIRINELANIQMQNLDSKRNMLTILAEVSKTRKPRTIPVSHKVMKKLMELHKENKLYFEPSVYLFLTAYGDSMITDTFRRRIYKYAKQAGIKRATPHMFRHTFARNYILKGGDIFTLQIILGHTEMTTTRRYIQIDENHVKERHKRFSAALNYL